MEYSFPNYIEGVSINIFSHDELKINITIAKSFYDTEKELAEILNESVENRIGDLAFSLFQKERNQPSNIIEIRNSISS